jgi:tetratricopeptide (TPR) repeat protein
VRAFRGRALVSAGRLPEAVEELARAAALRPSSYYAHRWLGEALRRSGKLEEALAELNRAVRLAPGERWARASRAMTFAQLDRAAAAEADFKTALRRPDHRVAGVLLWRSRWRHECGRVSEARADAEASFRLDGKDTRTLEWLERLRREAGA